MKKALLVFCSLIPLSSAATAQDLSETLADVGEAYARAYVDPLVRAIGADLNAGIVQVPLGRRPGDRFTFFLGLKVNGTRFSERDRTFDLTYANRVEIETEVHGETVRLLVPATITVRDAPTVFGAADVGTATVRVQHDTTASFLGAPVPVSIDTTYTIETIGGLTELPIMPLPVAHLELGTFLGTSVMARWLPTISFEDVGSIGIAGFGLRHDLSRYWAASPVDLTVQAMWQRLVVGDSADDEVVKALTSALALSAGRRFGLVSVYGGLQIQEAAVDVSYRHVLSVEDHSETVEVSFSDRRTGELRGFIGGGLHAGPVVLSMDVGVGAMTVFGVSLGVQL